MARFDSDIHLSNESTTVGKQFKSFVGNQATWGASFSSAWQAMGILGIPRAARAGFADCTLVRRRGILAPRRASAGSVLVVSVKRIRSLAWTNEEEGSLSGLDSEPGEVEWLGVANDSLR